MKRAATKKAPAPAQFIRTSADTLEMLDRFFPDEKTRWDRFFSKLPSDHPLSSMLPDAGLFNYVQTGKVSPSSILDIGCGNGRDAIFLAKSGFDVDAIDISSEVLKKAKTEARKQKVSINFCTASVFDIDFGKKRYDFVYDSGLLHHVFPHRRPQYLELISSLVKKGGHFGLVAFNEKMGTAAPDWELYNQKSLAGGISFSRKKLEYLLGMNFKCLEYKPMKKTSQECFGFDFLSTSLWKKL
jgi:2-polyprenyl-3-methyl-5-hydroxy-6-metoxy-1,4-benzoquinol methylase